MKNSILYHILPTWHGNWTFREPLTELWLHAISLCYSRYKLPVVVALARYRWEWTTQLPTRVPAMMQKIVLSQCRLQFTCPVQRVFIHLFDIRHRSSNSTNDQPATFQTKLITNFSPRTRLLNAKVLFVRPRHRYYERPVPSIHSG